jgi:hypothetical protein
MISENGKRKVIKKYVGVAKQLVNRALSGNLPATRLLLPLYQQELEKVAELQQRALHNANRTAKDLTDEDLEAMLRVAE